LVGFWCSGRDSNPRRWLSPENSRGQHTLGVTRLDRAIFGSRSFYRSHSCPEHFVKAGTRYFNRVPAAKREKQEKGEDN